MICKKLIIEQLILKLTTDLEVLVRAAYTAREEATNEESKAENKYDTRGLEASYLAGAQANRADELKSKLNLLNKLQSDRISSKNVIENTALVEVLIDGSESRWFFFLASIGGINITVADREIDTISQDSPLGSQFLGAKIGDLFERKVRATNREYEIVNIY